VKFELGRWTIARPGLVSTASRVVRPSRVQSDVDESARQHGETADGRSALTTGSACSDTASLCWCSVEVCRTCVPSRRGCRPVVMHTRIRMLGQSASSLLAVRVGLLDGE
jgi:hypothetical protein